jgi:hypothetical protein
MRMSADRYRGLTFEQAFWLDVAVMIKLAQVVGQVLAEVWRKKLEELREDDEANP